MLFWPVFFNQGVVYPHTSCCDFHTWCVLAQPFTSVCMLKGRGYWLVHTQPILLCQASTGPGWADSPVSRPSGPLPESTVFPARSQHYGRRHQDQNQELPDCSFWQPLPQPEPDQELLAELPGWAGLGVDGGSVDLPLIPHLISLTSCLLIASSLSFWTSYFTGPMPPSPPVFKIWPRVTNFGSHSDFRTPPPQQDMYMYVCLYGI